MEMIGYGYYDASVQLATMIVPVAVYFLILGLLNTRNKPQLLTARGDFSLLLVSLSPLLILPVLGAVGVSALSVTITAAVVGGAVLLLAPKGPSWVVYNLSIKKTINAVEDALIKMSLPYKPSRDGFVMNSDGDPFESPAIHISGFVLLRNVSIRLDRADADLAERFQAELHRSLSAIRTEANSMAVALLLVATAMLVAPVTLLAHKGVPELVRLLTGLMQ